jgi:hypothetical protein
MNTKQNKFIFILFFLLILIILICFNDCNKTKKEIAKFNLIISDTFCIFIDTSTSTFTKAIFYHKEQKKRYLVFNDEINRIINFYNIDNRKKELSIKIQNEGKFYIPYNNGFIVKKIDSIYIPTDALRIYLINRYGEILKCFAYDTINQYQQLIPAVSLTRFHSPIIFNGNYMYAPQTDAIYSYYNNNPANYKFCYRFNLTNYEAVLMPIHHPEDFWYDGVRELLCSWDFDGVRFIYSPICSHDIYISYDNNKIDEIKKVESKYVKKLLYYDPNNKKDINNALRLKVENQEYIGIAYDQFRNIYYRFFSSGYKGRYLKNKELFKKYLNPPNFGIMVLNKDFNILCEVILPENIYSQHKFFIAEEGLYLSADHPNNPNLKEDEWCFHIYNLVELKNN